MAHLRLDRCSEPCLEGGCRCPSSRCASSWFRLPWLARVLELRTAPIKRWSRDGRCGRVRVGRGGPGEEIRTRCIELLPLAAAVAASAATLPSPSLRLLGGVHRILCRTRKWRHVPPWMV